mgnify:CR=1 FL=1
MWWMVWMRYWMNSMQIGQLFWWQWMNHYSPATAQQMSAYYKAWTDAWPKYYAPFFTPFGVPPTGAASSSATKTAAPASAPTSAPAAAPAAAKPATGDKTEGKASTKLVADDSVVQLVKQQGGASERAANAVEEAMKRLGEKQPTNLAQVETRAA